MSEANRAYRAGDSDALQQVAALWDETAESGDSGRHAPIAQTRADILIMQIARMRKRFDEIEADLQRLFGSRLYELFLATRQAHGSGRDLLHEMATALDVKIAAARSQLGAGVMRTDG